MTDTKPIWIRDPLSILADGAERGIVVKDGRIVALVPAGATQYDEPLSAPITMSFAYVAVPQ